MYRGEIESWAEALDLPVGDVTLLNFSYELSQLTGLMSGCTAGIVQIPGRGLIHVRNLDWSLKSIGRATRLYRFHRGKPTFVTVGILGFVGALSGMVPGEYSVTLNWAPSRSLPRPHRIDATFLLRDVLESCNTYLQARRRLMNEPISSSVFYTVCGKRNGEACIIERVKDRANVRMIRRGMIVQGNAFSTASFAGQNTGSSDLLNDSAVRVESLERNLGKLKRKAIAEDVSRCLDVSPVKNESTCQQMIFHPRSGMLRVRSRR
jgi:acid ceramidase